MVEKLKEHERRTRELRALEKTLSETPEGVRIAWHVSSEDGHEYLELVRNQNGETIQGRLYKLSPTRSNGNLIKRYEERGNIQTGRINMIKYKGKEIKI
ncbi:MAG: hypothetical protein KC506_03125 [Nanoarchaeota archaeon]|nr:hypothetical protein [Nanoarchaeota archaeon]